MSSAEPRRTARGVAMRARILDAAADLIYAEGADRTSLDEILGRSGASKSQFYHYFADKDALLLDVIAVQTERVFAAQQPHLSALDSIAALQRWRDAIVALIEGPHRVGGCPLGSLANALSNRLEAARSALADSFEEWRGRIEGGLRTMQRHGALDPAANAADIAIGMLAALQGGLLLAKTMRSSRPVAVALDMALAQVRQHMPQLQ